MFINLFSKYITVSFDIEIKQVSNMVFYLKLWWWFTWVAATTVVTEGAVEGDRAPTCCKWPEACWGKWELETGVLDPEPDTAFGNDTATSLLLKIPEKNYKNDYMHLSLSPSLCLLVTM